MGCEDPLTKDVKKQCQCILYMIHEPTGTIISDFLLYKVYFKVVRNFVVIYCKESKI